MAMLTTTSALFAALALALSGVNAQMPPLPPIATCNGVVNCDSLGGHKVGVNGAPLICDDTTGPVGPLPKCTQDYCCNGEGPVPNVVQCIEAASGVNCDAQGGFKPPKTLPPPPGSAPGTPPISIQVLCATNGPFDSVPACNAAACCNGKAPAPTPSPSYNPGNTYTGLQRCSAAGVQCAKYKADPKDGKQMRCKNRAGTSVPCTPAHCCAPVPAPAPSYGSGTSGAGKSLTACDKAGIKCAGYKADPKTHGVMRCKPRAGSTRSCSQATCCKKGY